MNITMKSVTAWITLFLFVACASAFSEEQTTILTTEVIETFEANPTKNLGEATERWIARGSKFITREYNEEGELVGTYPKITVVDAYPSALFGMKNDTNQFGEKRKVLGIMGKFDRKGYNYIEIIPASPADGNTPEEQVIYEDINTGIEWVHDPIDMPGKVQYFDVWVWGSNYDYYIDAHFLDYRGMTHTFRMGDLHYAGWKALRVAIPRHVPQSEPYIPKFQPLVFTKFVLWTRPHERVDEFFVYLDHVNVLSDVAEERFDGDDLADPELTEQVWGSKTR